MKKTSSAKALSFLTAVCLLCGVLCTALPFTASAEEAASDSIVLLAASDFQAGSNESSAEIMTGILSAIRADGYTRADGLLFGGDYNTEYDDKTDDIQYVKDTVLSEYPDLPEENMVFVQGNHDPAESVGLSPSGANDTDDYGVFVIHEDDYMWYNNDEARIKRTAASLENYLNAKSAEGYEKPIFIVSHLALHYCKRTANDGDGVYAAYLFDVLNQYGGQGLNIIFLYGHNHNNKYDDYLGGSTVCLTAGDPIYIAQSGQKTAVPNVRTLNFTYLNAGYVGVAYCLNSTLSMTVFEIKDGVVEINRYTSGGKCSLKTAGAWAESLNESAATYGADESYLALTYTGPVYAGNTASDAGVSVVSAGISGLTVTESAEIPFPAVQTAYRHFELTAEGYTDGRDAYVYAELPDSFDSTRPVFVRDVSTGAIALAELQNGKAFFKTASLHGFELYQTVSVSLSAEKSVIYTPKSQFADGKDVLIVSATAEGQAFALKNTDGTSLSAEPVEIRSGYGGLYIRTEDDGVKWNFINDTDFGYASIIGDLKNVATGRYLIADDSGALLSTTENAEADYTAWRIASTQYGMYTLKDNGTPDRYYVKCDGAFTVSDTEDAVRRVYLFEASEVEVTVHVMTDSAIGNVAVGGTETDSHLYQIASDGSAEIIAVDLSMLKDKNGNAVSTAEAGTYTDLTVYYGETAVCEGYTLSVTAQTAPGEEGSAPPNADSDAPDSGSSSAWVWIVVAAVGAIAIVAAVFIAVKRKKK